MLPRLLGGIDQLPALRDISCCGNLDGDMFAVLHGMNRNRGVQACPRRDIDKINVIAFTDFLPVVPAVVIIDFVGILFGGEHLFDPVKFLLIKIAGDFDGHIVREIGKTLQRISAAVAGADECDTDVSDRFGTQTKHILLFGLTRRRRENIRFDGGTRRRCGAQKCAEDEFDFLHEIVPVLY